VGLATLCCSPPALLEAETLILPTQLQVEHLKTQLQCCVAAALAASDTFSVAGVAELMRLGDTTGSALDAPQVEAEAEDDTNFWILVMTGACALTELRCSSPVSLIISLSRPLTLTHHLGWNPRPGVLGSLLFVGSGVAYWRWGRAAVVAPELLDDANPNLLLEDAPPPSSYVSSSGKGQYNRALLAGQWGVRDPRECPRAGRGNVYAPRQNTVPPRHSARYSY
jgi:hypothetical protein